MGTSMTMTTACLTRVREQFENTHEKANVCLFILLGFFIYLLGTCYFLLVTCYLLQDQKENFFALLFFLFGRTKCGEGYQVDSEHCFNPT